MSPGRTLGAGSVSFAYLPIPFLDMQLSRLHTLVSIVVEFPKNTKILDG